MKIEQLIVQHLYQSKQVSLQGIGIFRLRPDVALPAEGDKDVAIPADAFSFEYNLKAPEDEPLVDYIVQQTGKIKPLASSDLESYAILAKQFLNLGKPLLIEGVGTILKNQKGIYEFSAGHFINPKIDDIFKPMAERKEDEVSFESESAPASGGRNMKITLVIAAIVVAGLALYYFLVIKNPNDAKPAEPSVVAADTIKPEPVKTDTAKTVLVHQDSTKVDTGNKNNTVAAPAPPAAKTDSSSFGIVLKDYDSKQAVQKAYNRLTNWGHKLTIVKVDSTKYKLVMPFTMPLSDTLKVRDSIKRFFGGKPYVQL